MEEMTMNGIQMLTSYGALGVITVYFMWKDMTITKKLEATLLSFTVAFETFLKVNKGDDSND